VFHFKHFLSDDEADHLINLAKPQMTKSTVVDNETGKSVDSQVRTSTGTFFQRGHDEVISAIEKRISHVSHLPEENGEGLQILHYVDGQKYEPHHDFFHDQFNARKDNGGQRIATVLIYLTTVEEGGETVFPKAEHKVTGGNWSECARKGLAVHPMKGDAVLFFSLLPDGSTDPMSMHGSCPTTKGEKWSATKWIHVGPFGLSAAQQRAKWGECIDADEHCGEWAAAGECTKNPAYMLSSCRLACKKCTPKSPGDKATQR
jgi:prolyl 4-hydroxylase